jgi:hypothetical protein
MKTKSSSKTKRRVSKERPLLTWEETLKALTDLRCDQDDVLLQTRRDHPMPPNVSPLGREELRLHERGKNDDPYTRLENLRFAVKASLRRRKLVAVMAAQLAGHLAARSPAGADVDRTTRAIADSSVNLAEAICLRLGL